MSDVKKTIDDAIQFGRCSTVSKECIATSAGVRLAGPGDSTPSYCGRERLARMLDSYEADIATATELRNRLKAMIDAVDAEAAKVVKDITK